MSVPFLTISAIAFQAHEESNMHHSGNWWFRNTTPSVLGFISHALLEGTNRSFGKFIGCNECSFIFVFFIRQGDTRMLLGGKRSLC